MAAPNDVKVDIDKPPPYAPAYHDVNYQQGPGYPSSQSYSPNYPAPTSGYNPGYPPPGSMQSPPPQHTVIHTQQAPAPHVIVVQQGPVGTGNCPVCRQGNMIEEYTCCGICLAIFFFPLGLICCLLMKDRRCSHCGIVR